MKELTRRRFSIGWDLRNPAWWLVMLMLVGGSVAFVYALWPGIEQWPIATGMAVVFSVPLAAVWLLLLRLPQLWARISTSGALVAMWWGGFVATGVYALQSNGAIITLLGHHWGIEPAMTWGAAIAAPFTEETGKALAIAAVLLASRQRLRTPMDGALLAGYSGAGFMITEDILYSINIAQLSFGENEWVSTMAIYFVRTMLFGFTSHVIMSAAVGAGVGYLVAAKGLDGARLRRVWLGVGLIVAGYGLHAAWNSPLPIWARFIYQAAVPLLVWWVLWGIRRAEHRWFLSTLKRPEALGPLEPHWLDTVAHSWIARRRYRNLVVRHYGPAALPLQRLVEARLSDLADAVASGDNEAADSLRAQVWWQVHPDGAPSVDPHTPPSQGTIAG